MMLTLLVACSSDDGGNATGGGAGGAGPGGGGAGGVGPGGGADGGGGTNAGGAGGGGGAAPAEDVELSDADFGCILDWPKVRRFRITNKLDNVEASLAVANDPGSADYPVGTLIQLIPTEAMVKRRKGFSPASNDWEFFFLDVSAQGTTIQARGTTDVVNGFGGNCLTCHAKAEPRYDLVCETDHGCDPLPFTGAQIEMVQQSDPRCPQQ